MTYLKQPPMVTHYFLNQNYNKIGKVVVLVIASPNFCTAGQCDIKIRVILVRA